MYVELIDGVKYSTKNPRVSNSMSDFKDAGYVIEDNEIIVDIDKLSFDAINDMLEVFDIHTQTEWTDRGVHLYFKKPKTSIRKREGITPLGIPVEYFYKKGNQLYTTICTKRNGKARTIENYGAREEFPDIFKPGTYENLLGLDEGEFRNNALYKHKKRIRRFDNWRKILGFINNRVLATSLPYEEFNQLSRDEGMALDGNEEYEIAEYLMRELGAVSYGNRLYIRDENDNYISEENAIARIVYRYCPGKRTRFVEEVVKQMALRSPLIPLNTEFKVKFNNGYLYRGDFYECNYRGFTPYVLDIDYNPDAEPVKEVDEYLDQLSNNDKAYRDRIVEVISHCFVVNKEFKRMLSKFHVIRGQGGNGKGTFLQVVKAILGAKNCSALSIKDMEDERYLYNMTGKLANLGDDIHNAPINDNQMKIIKNLSTCDPVEIRRMRENSTTEEFIITLIFTSNHVIKSFEKSEAYKRRVDWLPIFTKPVKKDPQFISKITTPKALTYWIKLVVDGYFRLYKNKGFTQCSIIKDYNKEYHEENDNTTVFVADLKEEQIIGKRPPEIYAIYEKWCQDNGDDPLSKKTLKESILRIHGLIVKTIRDKESKRLIKAYARPTTENEMRMLI